MWCRSNRITLLRRGGRKNRYEITQRTSVIIIVVLVYLVRVTKLLVVYEWRRRGDRLLIIKKSSVEIRVLM